MPPNLTSQSPTRVMITAPRSPAKSNSPLPPLVNARAAAVLCVL